MNLSKVGFGTYRVSMGNKEHELSLKKALLGGVNLIDTSSNYTDGMSEKLVGKVLKEIREQIPRERVFIVSKYGYIQGENMARHDEGFEISEIVPFHQDCYHSIHPDFMKDQLERSLNRLQTDYIDAYLIHNPEYYMMYSVKTPEERGKHQAEMLRRIGEAFVGLEEEVKNGKIRSYGISSNSLGKPSDDLHFIPYEGLIKLAEDAALKAGNEKHSFVMVQMPGNLLETEGLNGCAKWAGKNNLNVLVNRPLNAIKGDHLHRLASYKKPDDYEEVYKETHKMVSDIGNQDAVLFLEELHENKDMLQSVSHYQFILQGEMMPFFRRLLMDSTEDDSDLAARFIDRYGKEVKFHISRKTASFLKDRGFPIEEPLQLFALKFLADNPDVTCVLLGMRQRNYVDDAFRIINSRASVQA